MTQDERLTTHRGGAMYEGYRNPTPLAIAKFMRAADQGCDVFSDDESAENVRLWNADEFPNANEDDIEEIVAEYIQLLAEDRERGDR